MWLVAGAVTLTIAEVEMANGMTMGSKGVAMTIVEGTCKVR
jgi:hypothetical protein